MGTTLTNGIYLPNEGEKNCYAGLKTNWETLDQKIADITALQQAITGALHREIVATLPTTDIDPNTIYMILSGTSATENVYNEFMYVNNAWELIGTSATDLTNYYTKGDVDGLLLLKANASDLTSHTGDTTIHVTANDKTKWNNGVSQAYVVRYASIAVSDNSTVPYTDLNNVDNIKANDLLLDTKGKIYQISSVDTANETVSVTTPLTKLAVDSGVVHKSGNETVDGVKTFSDNLTIYNSDDTQTPKGLTIRNAQWGMGESGGTTVSNINFLDKNSSIPVSVMASKGLYGQSFLRFNVRTRDSQNTVYAEEIYYDIDTSGNVEFRSWHDNTISLGTSAYKWKSVYATNYYYGSNNVEFSTKFVTTDTNQTISGSKTFSSDLIVANTDTTANTPNLNLRNNKADRGTTDTAVQTITFLDKNAKTLTLIESRRISNGNTGTNILTYNTDDSNNTVSGGVSIIKSKTDTHFAPTTNNAVTCGRPLAKWSDVQTYKVNGVEPSSLSLPDLSNGIDISGYITNFGAGTVNEYTPIADGWISIANSADSPVFIRVYNDYGFEQLVYSERNEVGSTTGGTYTRFASLMIPCIKNIKIYIIVSPSSSVLISAKFYPCLGNV